MLRGVAVFISFAAVAAAQNGAVVPSNVSPATLPPLTLGERARMYTTATVGPSSLATSALASAINQWRDVPTEWGQGMEGFGRRVGSHVAGNGVSNALEFAVSALRHEDTRYRPSQATSFWRRAEHIIVNTYIVPTDNGGRTFAVSRLLGAYGSGFVANAWYPPGSNTAGEALIRGSWSLASDMGTSAFLEFWPDIKRKLFKRR